jgi:hypothetical protein
MRLLLVNGVNIAIDEKSIGGVRSRTHAAHEEQDSSGGSHHCDSFLQPQMKSRGLSRRLTHEMTAGSGRKFFLPSSGVFIESAHTLSAAQCNLNPLLI